MNELIEMMEKMADEIREKADQIGLKNVRLAVAVCPYIDWAEVECTDRYQGEPAREPHWRFCYEQYKSDDWEDRAEEYNK